MLSSISTSGAKSLYPANGYVQKANQISEVKTVKKSCTDGFEATYPNFDEITEYSLRLEEASPYSNGSVAYVIEDFNLYFSSMAKEYDKIRQEIMNSDLSEDEKYSKIESLNHAMKLHCGPMTSDGVFGNVGRTGFYDFEKIGKTFFDVLMATYDEHREKSAVEAVREKADELERLKLEGK